MRQRRFGAGLRCGAGTSSLDDRAETLDVNDLPTEFQALKPQEVEDVLCIFSDVAARPNWHR